MEFAFLHHRLVRFQRSLEAEAVKPRPCLPAVRMQVPVNGAKLHLVHPQSLIYAALAALSTG